jgi:hypothetical protein
MFRHIVVVVFSAFNVLEGLLSFQASLQIVHTPQDLIRYKKIRLKWTFIGGRWESAKLGVDFAAKISHPNLAAQSILSYGVTWF